MEFEKLFQEWKEEYDIPIFIKDGIVDNKQYNNILFILREMNTQEEIDLREYLRLGGDFHTWNNITRWTIALTENLNYPKYINNDIRKDILSKIAVINLNKHAGQSKTNYSFLYDTVKKQYHYIYEEIFMCNPDIIICCGLSSKNIPSLAQIVKEEILPFTSSWYSFTSLHLNRKWYYYYAYFNNKEIPVLSFVHPSLRGLNHCYGHRDLLKHLYEDMRNISTIKRIYD